MISFQCPQCSKDFRVPDEQAGKKGRCNQCGALMEIPQIEYEPIYQPKATIVPTPVVAPYHPPSPSQNVQVVVNQVQAKPQNWLGIIGLTIGLLSLCICWVPLLGIIAIPGGLLGGVLSFVGFVLAITTRRYGFGWAASGLCVNFGAVIVAFMMTIAVGRGINEAAVQVRNAARKAEADVKREREAQKKAQAFQPEPTVAP